MLRQTECVNRGRIIQTILVYITHQLKKYASTPPSKAKCAITHSKCEEHTNVDSAIGALVFHVPKSDIIMNELFYTLEHSYLVPSIILKRVT